MTITAEKTHEHIGQTAAMTDHDRDLVHELSKRLDAVWRYDQYIANAEGDDERIALWRRLKKQDKENVDRLRDLIKSEIDRGCF